MNILSVLSWNAVPELRRAHAALWAAAAEAVTRHVEEGESLSAQYQAACDMWSHGLRCAEYMRIMTACQEDSQKLTLAAAWHDVGKLCIPATVLMAPRELTVDERQIVERHAVQGREVALRAGKLLVTAGSALQCVSNMAASHHERWDGNGYPDGLKEEEIPFEARMMAIIDVYDVVTTVRSYKSASSHKTACETLATEAGSHFDPELVKRFLAIESDIEEAASIWHRIS